MCIKIHINTCMGSWFHIAPQLTKRHKNRFNPINLGFYCFLWVCLRMFFKTLRKLKDNMFFKISLNASVNHISSSKNQWRGFLLIRMNKFYLRQRSKVEPNREEELSFFFLVLLVSIEHEFNGCDYLNLLRTLFYRMIIGMFSDKSWKNVIFITYYYM